MVSGKNLVSGAKSEYTYNGLLARVKKTSGTSVSAYMPDYPGGIQNDLVTQISGVGTVNVVYGQGYGRVSQRFMPQAGTEASDTYFQHDLYGSTLFAADAQGVIRHHAAHDIWGMPKAVCDDTGIASGFRFTTYDYDSILGKHFAHARMYDPAQGRMLGIDPVKRGLNGYAYCDNDPANQTDPTGEVANVVIGGIAGAVIGGAFGFAGSALSQLAEGKGFNARKAWGAAANGAIVGAARGALIGSGAGIPLAFGVDFAAGMAGSLAEQKISGARIAPVRAAVDGAFNAAGGRLYGTSPLKNVKNAFIRGALEGAVKGGAYNIADALDNRLRNAYNARKRQKLRTTRRRNTWNKKNKNPWTSRNPRPTGSRSPQSHCGKPKPLKGMRNPKRRSSRNRIYRTRHILPDDRFRVKSFVRDVVAGAVMGGLASASFYGAGKAVEALKRGVERRSIQKIENYVIHAANRRVPYIVKTNSKKEIGPCFSTIYDPKLKQFYYGMNYKSGNDKALKAYKKWLEEEAHNIIQFRTNLYKEAIDNGLVNNLPPNHDIRLAAHSEVRALDLALKAREEAGMTVDEMTISDLFLYNIDMIKFFKGEGLIPKDRCENCKVITDGIHVIRHK